MITATISPKTGRFYSPPYVKMASGAKFILKEEEGRFLEKEKGRTRLQEIRDLYQTRDYRLFIQRGQWYIYVNS